MIAPQFATHRIGSPTASHTIELFLGQSPPLSLRAPPHLTPFPLSLTTDLVCPFSKKQLNGVRKTLIPLIENNEEVRKHLSIVIAQGKAPLIRTSPSYSLLTKCTFLDLVPQPWHASSTLVHEAALSVSKTLVDQGKSYSDQDVVEQWQKYFFELMDKQEVSPPHVPRDYAGRTRER